MMCLVCCPLFKGQIQISNFAASVEALAMSDSDSPIKAMSSPARKRTKSKPSRDDPDPPSDLEPMRKKQKKRVLAARLPSQHIQEDGSCLICAGTPCFCPNVVLKLHGHKDGEYTDADGTKKCWIRVFKPESGDHLLLGCFICMRMLGSNGGHVLPAAGGNSKVHTGHMVIPSRMNSDTLRGHKGHGVREETSLHT